MLIFHSYHSVISVTIKIRANSVFLLTAFNVMQLQQEIFVRITVILVEL